MKDKIVIFEKRQIQPFITSTLLSIYNLTATKFSEKLKTAKILVSKESGPNYDVKIVFLENRSQNMLNPI